MEALNAFYPDQYLFQYSFHISIRPAFVYVNNPKCGCTTTKASINRWYAESIGRDLNYGSLAEIHDRRFNPLLTPNQFGASAANDLVHAPDFFRFTLFRNPLDRLASAYASKLTWNSRERQLLNEAAGRGVESAMPLATFLSLIRDNPKLLDMNEHWRPQVNQISAPVMTYDQICLFDRLEADLLAVRDRLFPGSRLGVFKTLAHFPNNRSNSVEIRNMFTQADVTAVHEIYRRDFEAYESILDTRQLRGRTIQAGNDADAPASRNAQGGQANFVKIPEIVKRFESLGDNCEFGFVQRAHGVEAGGLLRWTVTPLPALLELLKTNFEGIYEFENLVPSAHDMVLDRKSGLFFHSQLKSKDAAFILAAGERHSIFQKEFSRVADHRRRMLDRLHDESVVMVYKTNHGVSLDDANRLSTAIALLGKARLLVVTAGSSVGKVTQISDRLLLGTIDRFAPYGKAHDVSLTAWTNILLEANRLTC